eukprot:258760-Rhodomonas_salina.1
MEVLWRPATARAPLSRYGATHLLCDVRACVFARLIFFPVSYQAKMDCRAREDIGGQGGTRGAAMDRGQRGCSPPPPNLMIARRNQRPENPQTPYSVYQQDD